MLKNNSLGAEKEMKEFLKETKKSKRENAKFLNKIKKRIAELDLEYAQLLLAKKALALNILKKKKNI
ncbi:MAG: hypothetical protein ABH881_00625 [bacterium]